MPLIRGIITVPNVHTKLSIRALMCAPIHDNLKHWSTYGESLSSNNQKSTTTNYSWGYKHA